MVWPGVLYRVTVVPPKVMVSPSLIAMSRLGAGSHIGVGKSGLVSSIVQSASPIATRG